MDGNPSKGIFERGTRENHATSLLTLDAQARQVARSFSGVAGLAAIFFIILWLRAPAALLHAGLWGEEGWFYYPDAYRFGMSSLFMPLGGYLNSLPRFVAISVQPLPLTIVPAIFVAVGLLSQAITAAFIVSNRMDSAWPCARARIIFALAYLVLPNTWEEIYGNLTDAQWHWAILAFCVLVAAPATNRRQIAFDALVLVVSGLSGPFCLLLLPIACWRLIEDRSAAIWWKAALVLAMSVVQAYVLLGHPSSRPDVPLGASGFVLARILSLQIFFGSLFGEHNMAALINTEFWKNSNFLPIAISMCGLTLSISAIFRGSSLLRKAMLFSGLSFSAALVTPLVSLTSAQWPIMTMPAAGDRYYVFPIIAWTGVLFTLAADQVRLLRITGFALLAVMALWGIPSDWHYPITPHTGFHKLAKKFQIAPPGTTIKFPVRTGGRPMVLTKE